MFEARNRVDFDQISVHDGETKRYSSSQLEQYWQADSQKENLPMPYWTHSDDVLQKILNRSDNPLPASALYLSGSETPSSIWTEDQEVAPTYSTSVGQGAYPTPPLSDDRRKIRGKHAEDLKNFSKRLPMPPKYLPQSQLQRRSLSVIRLISPCKISRTRRSRSLPARKGGNLASSRIT